MDQPAERITVDPEQCGDRPCIRGMRMRVSDGLDLFAAGLTAEQRFWTKKCPISSRRTFRRLCGLHRAGPSIRCWWRDRPDRRCCLRARVARCQGRSDLGAHRPDRGVGSAPAEVIRRPAPARTRNGQRAAVNGQRLDRSLGRPYSSCRRLAAISPEGSASSESWPTSMTERARSRDPPFHAVHPTPDWIMNPLRPCLQQVRWSSIG